MDIEELLKHPEQIVQVEIENKISENQEAAMD